jgi:hypothetical protein
MFAAAKSRHIIAVRKSLTEADKVSLDSVIVVRTLNVKTETRSYVVEDKNYAVVVAPFSYARPVLGIGRDVVVEVAVVIRLSDKTCNIAVVLIIELLQCVNVKPGCNKIVTDVLGKNAGIVNLLSPLEVAVIVAL